MVNKIFNIFLYWFFLVQIKFFLLVYQIFFNRKGFFSSVTLNQGSKDSAFPSNFLIRLFLDAYSCNWVNADQLIEMLLRKYQESRSGEKLATLISRSTLAGIYYSQEGEDIIIQRILGDREGLKGFYVDVGAHHPIRFSNTYGLYLKGWRGVNIDARPGSSYEFNLLRPRDINIEAGVSSHKSLLEYFSFEESALNTFDRRLADEYISKGCPLSNIEKIRTRRLDELLDEVIPSGVEIDLMSIDVEGLEFSVLESNNWERYIPKLIVIEDLKRDSVLHEISNSAISFLINRGYKIRAQLFNSVILVRS